MNFRIQFGGWKQYSYDMMYSNILLRLCNVYTVCTHISKLLQKHYIAIYFFMNINGKPDK